MLFTDFKILLITFKVLEDVAPTFLSDPIAVSKSSRCNLRSTDNGVLLQYSRTKSYKTLGDRAFMFAAPKLWNALPLVIRSTTCLSCFKVKVQTFFI